METPFENKCVILADLWINYRDDEDFEDFVKYNDLGLPLAYALANGIIEKSEMAEKFIGETFSLLLDGLEIEDEGFELLDDVLGATEND